jgi:peptidoglycan hydrolase-like protein with peptidoglycan-binding domain
MAPRVARQCGGTRLDFGSYPRLKQGSRGDRVKALQCLLKKNARYRGRLDARFDGGVVRAVRSFQRRHDLRLTGQGDAATWTALFAKGAAPLLKFGSAGEAVLRLQRALRAARARSVEPTGVLSDRTAKAVARYQQRMGLDPSGVVTYDTWSRLQQGMR